ncbi:MAG: energy-coupling factor transporter transmembrane component T [Candidatus Cloacimonetes bacterium]|nr:energy-coupling factor transporter transmembrane component T [Candidatus Cloacimonadota bacterium]
MIWLTSLALLYEDLLVLSSLLIICILQLFLHNPGAVSRILRRVLYLIPLILSIFFFQILFRKQGPVLFELGGFGIHLPAVTLSAAVGLRLMIIVLAAGIIFKLDFPDFRNAFGLIRLPEELAFMVSFVLGFLPMVSESFAHLQSVIQRRGVESRGFKVRIRIFKLIVGTVLANSLAKTSEQAINLELRGFRSQGKHSIYQASGLRMLDWSWYLAIAGLSVILYWISIFPRK